MADPVENGALRTEDEKGTNVGTYDPAVRTEEEKEPFQTHQMML